MLHAQKRQRRPQCFLLWSLSLGSGMVGYFSFYFFWFPDIPEGEEYVFVLFCFWNLFFFILFLSLFLLTRSIYMSVSSIAVQERAGFPPSILRAIPGYPRSTWSACEEAWTVVFKCSAACSVYQVLILYMDEPWAVAQLGSSDNLGSEALGNWG